MANDLQPKDELEIAHVLFIDVVGYSRLLINEQAAVVAELNQLVRETPHFRSAEAAGRLIRIPTGDGMALVFSNTPEAPVQCALEICQALRAHPEIHVRMGIHSGPVDSVPTLMTGQPSPGPESILPSALWIAPMPVTFCFQSALPKTCRNTRT